VSRYRTAPLHGHGIADQAPRLRSLPGDAPKAKAMRLHLDRKSPSGPIFELCFGFAVRASVVHTLHRADGHPVAITPLEKGDHRGLHATSLSGGR